MADEKFKCPCCGEATLEEQDAYCICDKCGWQDDPDQTKNPDLPTGANMLSLNKAKEVWSKHHDSIFNHEDEWEESSVE